MAGFSDAPMIQSIAVPAVCLLIAFLSYFSQYVFHRSTTLDPGPPSRHETIVFNALLLLLWYTYYKAVTVDAGRYVFADKVIEAEGRWCKKCAAPKPPRAHHCRHCGRCVPKMDHHCPWTRNCVSMTTFPHFLRFLAYANAALWMLGSFIWQRFATLWDARYQPAYLGPSLQALIALAVVSLTWFVTTVALGIMLVTTTKSWIFNMTMIEGWELDRHEIISERGGRDWWDVTGPDGKKMRFERTEFPYDIGFFSNMSQAMGTRNVLLWFLPFAGGPTVGKDKKGTGWSWPENGFNRKEGMWPPLDPEKIRRAAKAWPAARRDFDAELREAESLSPEEQKRAFRERQLRDAEARGILIAELEEVNDYDVVDGVDGDVYDSSDDHASDTRDWVNSDGERLRDYGVDEDAEQIEPEPYDDDVPLGELLRRRNVTRARDDA